MHLHQCITCTVQLAWLPRWYVVLNAGHSIQSRRWCLFFCFSSVVVVEQRKIHNLCSPHNANVAWRHTQRSLCFALLGEGCILWRLRCVCCVCVFYAFVSTIWRKLTHWCWSWPQFIMVFTLISFTRYACIGQDSGTVDMFVDNDRCEGRIAWLQS